MAVQNKVVRYTSKEIREIKETILRANDMFIVEIDGSKIRNWDDYISIIQEKFSFPTTCNDSMDRYLDWIRDLSWIDSQKYSIIISNFDAFLKNDIHLRDEIIHDFEEIILPFFEFEIEQCVVGGHSKLFMLYLVD